jgi:hypothetical protein
VGEGALGHAPQFRKHLPRSSVTNPRQMD